MVILIDNPIRNPVYVLLGRSPYIHSNSARRSSEEGARGGWLPADEDDDGGVARSSPSAGASKYDSSSIGSTLVSGNNWNKKTSQDYLAFTCVECFSVMFACCL